MTKASEDDFGRSINKKESCLYDVTNPKSINDHFDNVELWIGTSIKLQLVSRIMWTIVLFVGFITLQHNSNGSLNRNTLLASHEKNYDMANGTYFVNES